MADSSALRNEVADTPSGRQAKLTVWRDKKQQEFRVTIGSTEDAVKLLSAAVDQRLGVTVRPITPKEDEKYGIDPGEGVAIATVSPKGPIAQAGLEPRDLILQVNGESVKGMEGFADLMSSLPAKQPLMILALDHRSGRSGYVQMTLN